MTEPATDATTAAAAVTARLAVTMGDPAGIGPEIVLKALAAMAPSARPLVIGDPAWLAELAARLGHTPPVRRITAVSARSATDAIDVLAAGAPLAGVTPGRVDAGA
ncbi:MAG: 4-hydroxythreonine-4-phosphate dehydrogenase PdxA, partial [Alphaproteobacteria bacterium]